ILSKKDIEKIINRPMARYFWNMEDIRFQAEQDAATARLRGIAYVPIASADYPPLLREIWDPPALLFYRGILPPPDKPLAAIVGTRRPTPQGLAQAYDIARDIAAEGIPVVSGLALGIDAMAHRGALDGGAPTLAVLGSALDQVYPSSNRILARRILEAGGGLLSEYPPGVGPARWRFPARNRIISGLARGSLIVEAPARSGSLITARFALEQGRDLWVSRAGILSSQGEGCRNLAEEGAGIIASAGEILKEWGIPAGKKSKTPLPGEEDPSTGTALALSLARSLNIKW
ncbi:MAG: DNA-processing protein DprA, partial [Treponema sp.]|nr:DNA-processing protein DprA [Treponema sp.]